MKTTAPVEKNQELTVDIEDLTYEGMGVAKVDGYPLFVADTLPGEKVKLVVTKTGKNFGFARALELLTTSPDRVDLKDKAYMQTGIAPLGHLSYEGQLKFKQHQIAEVFQKSHLDIPVLPTIGMEKPYAYRNKAQVPVRMLYGEIQTGFYRKGSHNLVPMEDYYIQDPAIDKAIVIIRDLLRQYNVAPYNESQQKGVMRNIMIRRGHFSHEMMVILITRTRDVPHLNELIAGILNKIPEVVSIMQSVNPKNTNVVLGRTVKKLYGKSFIRDQILGLNFDISALSFYQVNPVQTERLYTRAIEQAGLTGKEVVIDAYSGIGTMSLAMAQHAKYVYGVEVVVPAVADAKRNAKLNGIHNVKFEAGKAEEVMQQWKADGLEADVLMVDPPRKGLAKSFVDAVGQMKPKRVVYVSCNPATLARDLSLLQEFGYHAKETQPVDMFPQTQHIESVTMLSLD
ncbi:23S rRNA (uracil(1939)-C(5))-methyltransferase RlmD [Loigolactobacillus iwatensis]|uniref:23S rRNA (uracil(1939)-C(5))-methyltransferase RlmD n=1 Tax=Loigolactobacillus iwatensis TaxID=1267156 RepID=UPI000F7E9273|nr:23S rRNA (uracil(1939)-C(5))-methyltransferase RlmD [Loigolactobacillus iwatensis]